MFTQSYFAMNILLLHSPYYLYYSFTNRSFKDGNLSNPVFHLNIGGAFKMVLTRVLHFWLAEHQEKWNSWGLTYSWLMERHAFIFFFFTTHKNNFLFLGKNAKITLTYFCNVLTDSWRCYKVPSQSTVIIRLWGCWFHRWREEKKRRASMMALLFSRSWRCSLLRKECHELVLNCTYMTWFQSAKTDPKFFIFLYQDLGSEREIGGSLGKRKIE